MGLFNTVKIRTPESVELEFTLAGIGSRAIALTLDYTILALVMVLLSLIYVFVMFQLSGAEALLFMPANTVQLWVTAIFSLMLFAIYLGYFVGFETYWYGQTPGKRFSKIQVIRDDGQPCRLFQATLRSLLRPVDDILFLGFFCILLSRQEKRLGDWLAGTLVVQTDPSTVGDSTLEVLERSREIGKDLLTLVDFDAITPDDFATLRLYLQRRAQMTAKAQGEVSLHLAQRLKSQLALETLPTEMTASTFLEAVYWAYQQKYPERR